MAVRIVAKQQVNERRIVGCDIESTGLVASEGLLLEVALVVLDNDLNELAAHHYLVPARRSTVIAAMQDPVVSEMHERSGLRADHEHDTRLLDLAGFYLPMVRTLREQEATKFLRVNGAIDAPLLGNNVSFDREWLRVHQPLLESHFHYRNIDVSSVKEIARRWAPEVFESAPANRGTHRALDDIRESVAELAHYRAAGLLGAPPLTDRQGSPDALNRIS